MPFWPPPSPPPQITYPPLKAKTTPPPPPLAKSSRYLAHLYGPRIHACEYQLSPSIPNVGVCCLLLHTTVFWTNIDGTLQQYEKKRELSRNMFRKLALTVALLTIASEVISQSFMLYFPIQFLILTLLDNCLKVSLLKTNEDSKNCVKHLMSVFVLYAIELYWR